MDYIDGQEQLTVQKIPLLRLEGHAHALSLMSSSAHHGVSDSHQKTRERSLQETHINQTTLLSLILKLYNKYNVGVF